MHSRVDGIVRTRLAARAGASRPQGCGFGAPVATSVDRESHNVAALRAGQLGVGGRGQFESQPLAAAHVFKCCAPPGQLWDGRPQLGTDTEPGRAVCTAGMLPRGWPQPDFVRGRCLLKHSGRSMLTSNWPVPAAFALGWFRGENARWQ